MRSLLGEYLDEQGEQMSDFNVHCALLHVSLHKCGFVFNLAVCTAEGGVMVTVKEPYNRD